MIDLFHCLMQVIEPKCTETTKTVKRYVTETVSLNIHNFFALHWIINLPFQVCELIPTPKCQMTPCPVDATFVGMEVIIATKKIQMDAPFLPIQLYFTEHYEESFEPWECELRPKILYHHKWEWLQRQENWTFPHPEPSQFVTMCPSLTFNFNNVSNFNF